MPAFSQRLTIEEIRAIRDRHSIVDVLGRYGVAPPSRWNGASDFLVNCPEPNHDDSTPSCNVHPQTDTFYCFGCGAHGDVLQLVCDLEGVRSLTQAVRILEGGSEPFAPRAESRFVDLALETPQARSLERVLEINHAAWEELTDPAARTLAERYLASRGLNLDALEERYGPGLVGFSPPDPDGLSRRLLDLGYRPDEVIQAGWLVQRDGREFDRFRHRVLFPYRDETGGLRGVIGRDVTGRARAKYVNTPTGQHFRKGDLIYCPDRLSTPAPAIIVCEGPVDALAVASRLELDASVVSPCGTALTAAQANLISARRPSRIVLLPDGDAAGRAALTKWTSLFDGMDAVVVPCALDPGDDPARYNSGSRSIGSLLAAPSQVHDAFTPPVI
jgi:DNA primase